MVTIPNILKHNDQSNTAFTQLNKGKLEKFTYLEIDRYSDNLAHKLTEIGIKPESKIAIKAKNSVQWVVSFFSILKLGCVCVPIDIKMNDFASEKIIKLSGAELLISEKDAKFEVKELNIYDFFNSSINENHKKIDKLSEDCKDKIAIILYTSGTTGDPKGAMLSNKNILSNINEISKMLQEEGKLKSFSVLPMSHVYELTCNILVSLNLMNTVHFCSGLDIKTLSKELKLIRPNIFPVVPLLLEKIYNGISKKQIKSNILKNIIRFFPKLFGYIFRKSIGLDKLKFFFCGGAPLSFEIESFFDRIGLKVIQGYGLTEASPLVSVNPLKSKKIGSVGKVINSCDLKILDKDSSGNGVIHVKGPNIFQGYYNNVDATEESLIDNYLNTGDIGRKDDEDYLFISGRKKFVIIGPSGENIYPEEIEELLNNFIEIQESVIFSLDQKQISVLIKLNDEYRDISFDKIKKIINYINNKIERYKRISKIYLSDIEFEKTSTQKIKREFLKNIDVSEYKSIM